MTANTQQPESAQPAAVTQAPQAKPAMPVAIRGVVPIPRTPPNGTPYLIGLIATLVVSIAAIIVVQVTTKPAVPDRFGASSSAMTGDDPGATRDVRITPSTPNPPPPKNRRTIGRQAEFSDPDAPRRLVDELRYTRVRPSVPEMPRQGPPREIIEMWLQALTDKEFITRFDFLADEPYDDHGTAMRRVYYVVQAYVGMTRNDIRRQLYRFEFLSSGGIIQGLERKLQDLQEAAGRGDMAPQMIDEQVGEVHTQLEMVRAHPANEFLMSHMVVRESDPDYNRLMTK